MIPIKFEELTEEQKDAMLKTLILAVFRTVDEEFALLKQYSKYGGQAFDASVKVYEDKNTIYFKMKKLTKEK